MYARKANFDDVYNRQDPRAYFAALHPLDYAVPHYAQPVIRNCVGRIAHLRGIARPVVLDLCAGYGINGALLNHVLTLEKLYAHYVGSSTRDLSAEELLAYDQFFYRCFRRRDSCAAVIGLDIAAEAIAYAQGAGLVDHGVVCDLERTDPDVKTRQLLGAADLITVTGGISYIGDHSLRRLLSYFPSQRMPLIVWFPLRSANVAPIVAALAEFGLLSTRWHTLFPQRRFRDSAEKRRAGRNQPPAGHFARQIPGDDYLYAALYLSWPQSMDDSVNMLELVNGVECAPPVSVSVEHG